MEKSSLEAPADIGRLDLYMYSLTVDGSVNVVWWVSRKNVECSDYFDRLLCMYRKIAAEI